MDSSFSAYTCECLARLARPTLAARLWTRELQGDVTASYFWVTLRSAAELEPVLVVQA